MQSVDGVQVGGSTEIHIPLQGGSDNLVGGCAHNFLQAGLHDVEFSGSFQQLAHGSIKVEFGGSLKHLLDNLQHVSLGFFLPLTVESTRSHVIEVLEPLEVAGSHTSGIAQDIGQELDSLSKQFFLSTESSGSVGSLNDEGSLELVGILQVNGLFEGGGDEEIAKLFSFVRLFVDG